MKFTLKGDYKSREVWLNGILLDPAHSQKIRNHSPDGFSWGYGGSGPAQLALAICLELMPEDKARRYYQTLKWDVIAKLKQGDFNLEIEHPVKEKDIQPPAKDTIFNEIAR